VNAVRQSRQGLIGVAAVLALSLGGAAAVHFLAAWEHRQDAVLPWQSIGLADLAAALVPLLVGALSLRGRRPPPQVSDDLRQPYRAVLESSIDGIVTLGAGQAILSASPRAAALFGYDPEALSGKPLSLLLPQPLPLPPDAGASQWYKVRELKGRHKNGNEVAVEVHIGPALPGEQAATTLLLRDVTRSKRTAETLNVREAHMRQIVKQMPAMLWTTDTQLRITSTFGAGFAGVGLQQDEIIGRSMPECLEQSNLDAAPIAAHLEAVKGKSLSYEMEWKGRSFQVRVDPLRSTDEKIIGTVGVFLDVTDHKQTMAQLQAREREQAAVSAFSLRALACTSTDTLLHEGARVVTSVLGVEHCEVLEWDPAGKVLHLRAAIGYKPGQRDANRVRGEHDSQAAYALRAAEPVIVADMLWERRFRAADLFHQYGIVSGASTAIPGTSGPQGVVSAYATRPRTFTADDLRFLQSIASIMGARIARHQAEDAQGQLVAILEATPDFVAIAGPDQRLSYVNRAGRAMLGLTEDEDVSRYSLTSFYPEERRGARAGEEMAAALDTGAWRGETALRARGGKEIAVSQVLIAHRSLAGECQFLSTIARDLTDRQHLEAQLRQSQKMEAVGRLAGGIAHDFNNLLTVITGYSGFLVESLTEEGQLDYAREVHRAGERAADLTRQLLAFSRKQMLVPRTVNLNALVAETEKMLRRVIGEDVELQTQLAPDLHSVRADPGQVEQILVNLAVNARDAMPTGGRLTLTTANVVLDDAAVRDFPDVQPGPHVLLAVGDTGCGMDSELQSHIFEPFFTTKEVGKGTGLGLATVYGIVKQSGGHIDVDSAPGLGTTFRIYLPRVEQEAASAGEAQPPAEVRGGTETILLVEDEESVRSLARHVLQQKGYTVLEAGDAVGAQRLGTEHGAAIDLLLTDVVMPGPGGPAVADFIRSRHPGIKVLFMSGFTESAMVRHDLQSGEIECLLKPFTPADLAQMVRQVLDQPPPGRAPPAGEEPTLCYVR
jgi:PAS domain S-box-containing protein